MIDEVKILAKLEFFFFINNHTVEFNTVDKQMYTV